MRDTQKTRRSPSRTEKQEEAARSLVGSVVRVDWEDIWADISEHTRRDWASNQLYRTYGLCVDETDDLVRIAQDVRGGGDVFRSVTHIYKRNIVKVVIYAEPESAQAS